MNLKKCTCCGVEKEYTIEFFHRQKDRLHPACKECRNAKQREYNIRNNTKQKEYNDEYRKNNVQKIKEKSKKYYKENRDKILKYKLEYERKRRKTDISYRIKKNLRRRMSLSLKGAVKDDTTQKLLGCSLKTLISHFESLFKEGMTWKNYGNPNGDYFSGWHIDHIKPCSMFDLTNPTEQRECFHYTNLQPLWAKENMEKSDKLR